MKIGIYGGSFNPVHFGHLGLAHWTVEHTDLDELWMLVTPNNPLKDPTILADEQTRFQALQDALHTTLYPLHTTPNIKASDFEFHLPKPTYTANTLRELVKTYPEHEFTLIIGEDNWHIFNQWREHDYILSHFRIFVYPRHASTPRPTPPLTPSLTSTVHFLKDAPYFDISSTELRHQGLR